MVTALIIIALVAAGVILGGYVLVYGTDPRPGDTNCRGRRQ